MKTLGRIDGVLGQSWLQRFDYIIDYRRSVISLDVEAPEGDRLPLSLKDGRPAIAVRTDDQLRWMILDSGAPMPVLFGGDASNGTPLQLASNNGAVAAKRTGVRLHVPGTKPKHLAAALINSEPSREGGLLPLRIFSSIYVNNRERYAIVRNR